MARTTHEKELERARARRHAERAQRQRAVRLMVALVVVLVVAAVALGAVLLNREGAAEQATSDAAARDAETRSESDDSGAQDEDAGDLDLAAVEPQPVTAEPCPAATDGLPTPRTTPYAERPTVDLGSAETVLATLSTTCGDVVVELDAAAAPATVANFVALAEDGYYEGVGFHRVINGFMVQGGDPTGTGTGCVDDGCTQRLPGYQFSDELQLAEELVESVGGYPRGTLAMANAGPDTNGSQFFVIQGDPGYPLPAQYAVFGSVVEGMDVVDRIAQGPVDGQLATDPVVILEVTVER